MGLAGPRVREVGERVVGGRRLHQAREHGRLSPGQSGRLFGEVAAARGGQPVVAVAEVGDGGVHPQDVRLRVVQVQFDAEQDLLGFGQHP
jgi:hypothetical protein